MQHGHVTILPLPVPLVHELHCTVPLDFVTSRNRTKANRLKSYKQTDATCDVLQICQTGVALLMPRRSLEASSSRTLGFGLRTVNVGSVVDKVALGQIFSLGRLRWDLREGDHLEDPGADGRISK